MSGSRRRPLTIEEILTWADIHREATGRWPNRDSGCVLGAQLENWHAVDRALRLGRRTLAGGSSLIQLLIEKRGVRNRHAPPPLTEQQILQWADQHRQRTGSWPMSKSGAIPDSHGETWPAVDTALRQGIRSLPGGSSLAKLLAEQRGVRNHMDVPPLTEEQILQWADAYCQRHGDWPDVQSGPIAESPGDTWAAVEAALYTGNRGLPGGSTLCSLLAARRGVPSQRDRPKLSIEQILIWADAFHERTGKWPMRTSGTIAEAPAETWSIVELALRYGVRGLAGGSSLSQLLSQQRGVRNVRKPPRFSRPQIVRWAKAYFRRTQAWPTRDAGAILEAPEDTWAAVDAALRHGNRGLRGGSSLARLLAEQVGKRNIHDLPPLSRKKILAWADAHYQRTGQWPNTNSGVIVEVPGERWDLIDNALREGSRQLPGGSSLSRLLAKRRGVPNRANLPRLTEEQILQWADLHFQRTGSWPTERSGPIDGAAGETWPRVDDALRKGLRGLPGRSSLPQLLGRTGRDAQGRFRQVETGEGVAE